MEFRKNMSGLSTPHFVQERQFPPYLHLLKMVTAIPTSTQSGCRHTYIYSKQLPPYLHLPKKTVAAIPTSTQNSYLHTYIHSKQLPPYLHLLKTVASIPTSTQNGCHHLYIYSKRVDVIMAGQQIKGRNVFQFMKSEELMVREDTKLVRMCYKLAGTNFTIRKIKFR